MSRWGSVALVAGVAVTGAVATFAVGAAQGMPGDELVHVGLLLLPALAVTLLCVAVAIPLLTKTPIRQRLIAVALIASLVASANLVVLAGLMFVDPHDAEQMGVLVFYSMGTGVGVALALARSAGSAMGRLSEAAQQLGSGDLDARVGELHAGPELDGLARTFDEMADQLQRLMDRERAVEATRRDLVTAVSHDLRTPLTALRAMAESIDDGVVEDLPTLKRYANEMRRSVQALVNLVNDLFEFAQLDAGAIEAESERARLEDVVGSAVAACHMQALQKGVDLKTQLDGAGGALCSPRLIRVLQNLLQNAIQHTPSDGTVRLQVQRVTTGLELVVEDTGEGIAPEHLGRVFEPFFRADEARSGGGSGLGLALAKRIVEALGGDIQVESVPAGGSRFAVVLPQGR